MRRFRAVSMPTMIVAHLVSEAKAQAQAQAQEAEEEDVNIYFFSLLYLKPSGRRRRSI
jgi:hypothetical protein